MRRSRPPQKAASSGPLVWGAAPCWSSNSIRPTISPCEHASNASKSLIPERQTLKEVPSSSWFHVADKLRVDSERSVSSTESSPCDQFGDVADVDTARPSDPRVQTEFSAKAPDDI